MKNSLLLDAFHKKNHSGRPPIWIMRQAGRYLPEYRKIREKHSFMEMVKTPEVAAEVTLQPIRRFGFDAAIIFSDILTVPEVLGKPVHFVEGVGPVFDSPINQLSDIEGLENRNVSETLGFIQEALRVTKASLDIPLLGFCGAPFTVASYMIEGKSSRDLKKTKQLMLTHPEAFHKLLDKICDASIAYLHLQIEAGADALQIFDSWAHVLSEPHFIQFASHYHKKMIAALKQTNTPITLFCRGCTSYIDHLEGTCASALSLDWTCNLAAIRQHSSVVLQGNLDPCVLYAPSETIRREANQLLDSMEDDPGYIFNLGHGIMPDIPIASVQTLVETVQCREKKQSYTF